MLMSEAVERSNEGKQIPQVVPGPNGVCPPQACPTQVPCPTEMPQVDPSQWLERYGEAMYNYAYRRLQRHELAEEAVQDALLAGIRNLKQFRGEASEQTWLFSILRFRIFDGLSKQRLTARLLRSLEDEVDPGRGVFDAQGGWQEGIFSKNRCHLEAAELRELVLQCLQQLPTILSAIFTLKILNEKSSEEICQDLQISPTNYWKRLHRARIGLAKCVSEKWPVGGH